MTGSACALQDECHQHRITERYVSGIVALSHLDERSDRLLQGNMHHFQHKVPIHGCPVDILKLNSWTRRPIHPTDMSTDKALNIRCRRQFFY